MKQLTVRELCQQAPVIPVLVIDQLDGVEDLGVALVEGGLTVLEITLRTPVALEAITRLRKIKNAIVGAGTLLTAKDVTAAVSAGAQFGVSPGTTDELLQAAKENNLPLLPGVATASEIMKLLEKGLDTFKFFPAEAAGGVPMLKSWSGPLANVRFCPTGGITESNKSDYLSLPNVLCVGGSWVAPAKLVKEKNWKAITELAKKACIR